MHLRAGRTYARHRTAARADFLREYGIHHRELDTWPWADTLAYLMGLSAKSVYWGQVRAETGEDQLDAEGNPTGATVPQHKRRKRARTETAEQAQARLARMSGGTVKVAGAK